MLKRKTCDHECEILCYLFLFQKRTVRKESSSKAKLTPAQAMRQRIVRRVALEFKDGMYGIL